MDYVYLLKNDSDAIYYGSTNDLRKRIKWHNAGYVRSTVSGKPWKLVYDEAYASETDAREREHQLKHHGQALAQLKCRIRHSLYES